MYEFIFKKFVQLEGGFFELLPVLIKFILYGL